MEVFELSREKKIVAYVVLSILLAMFGRLAVNCFIDPSFEGNIAVTLPVLLVVIFFIIGGLLQVNDKLIFDEYSIRKESKLFKRKILLDDVKGYSTDGNYLCIIPYKGKRIRVSVYFTGIKRLTERLAKSYPDLNYQTVVAIYEEAKRNGKPDENTEKRLKAARREVYALTYITGILCVLSFLYFEWYYLALVCCVPLALLLLLRHKGLVELDTSVRSVLPSIMLIPVMVVIVQLLQLSRIRVLGYGKAWMLALFVAAALTAMLWTCSRYLNRKRRGYIIAAVAMVLVFVGNGYGLVVSANAMFDKEDYEHYETKVFNKSASQEPPKRYYLILQPWPHQTEWERESVDRSIYNEVQVNDKISIYYHHGALHIPWYQIEKPEY